MLLLQVRLQNGEGKSVKPANLEAAAASESGGPKAGRGVVMVFWGDAQWSRAQLLGEIARGSWGMCRAGVSELLVEPEKRRRGLDGRLAFAPITEMSDDYVRDAQGQMELLRGQAQAQGAASSASHGAADAHGGGDGDVSSRPEVPQEAPGGDNDPDGAGNAEESAACGEEEEEEEGPKDGQSHEAAASAADAAARGSGETGISKAAEDEAPNSVESHPLGVISDSED